MFSRIDDRKTWLTGAVCMVLAICFVSCDAFTVRDGEPPEGTSGPTDVVKPFEPGLVISNMINSMEGKTVTDYNDLFADDFVFVADLSDVIELENYYPGALSDWDVSVEEQVAQRLLDQGQTANILLSFIEGQVDETDSTYVVQEDYRLRIVDPEGVLESYVGTAIFHMRLYEDGLWYIYKWEDFRPESDDDGRETWGMLKGEIRSTI
jgi:hypothetical protein